MDDDGQRHTRDGLCTHPADTTVFVDRGEIVEREPPKEFIANAESDRIRMLLSQIFAN
jgi:ABC-type polar amino acid transport system ATPase subunit